MGRLEQLAGRNTFQALSSRLLAQDYVRSTLCFDDTAIATAPFGPMGSDASPDHLYLQGNRNRSNLQPTGLTAPLSSSTVSIPPTACFPQCNPPGNPGILDAFVFQNASQLGSPYSLIDKQYVEGGYAITLPANITRAQYSAIVFDAMRLRWLDRQTRSITVHMTLYNVQTYVAADLHLRVRVLGDLWGTYGCFFIRHLSYSAAHAPCHAITKPVSNRHANGRSI